MLFWHPKNEIQVLAIRIQMDGRKPAAHEIGRELPYTRKLLREWPKLEVGGDGLLIAR